MRRIAYLLSSLTVLFATFSVPMPLVEFSPGGSTVVAPLIEVDADVATTPINGELSFLTVRLSQPTVAEVVRAWTSSFRDLEPRSQVIPAGTDDDEYFDFQRSQFQRSFEIAVAVGLQAAGEPVSVETAPLIAQVLRGGPADRLLQAGDVVEAINGERVTTADELITAAYGLELGDRVQLTVERAGAELEVEVVAGRVPGLDRPGLGVSLATVPDDVDLPFPIRMGDTRIGGPSAGMMIAVTIYDLFTEEDLTAGRTIAGTGTVDRNGTVGPIGGIREKVAAAVQAGADIMLVPASQAAQARAVEPAELTIVPVATVQEAIAALQAPTAGGQGQAGTDSRAVPASTQRRNQLPSSFIPDPVRTDSGWN